MEEVKILNVAVNLLAAVIIACLPIITRYVTKALSAAAEQLANDTKSTTAAKCIKEINDAVCTAVTAVNQTYVDAIKNSENPFTKEEQRNAFDKAYQIAIASLCQSTKDFITENYGTIEYYLESKIEAEVKNQKEGFATLEISE
jgi:uncharacterized protein YsxB (DUF464 family)